MKKIEVLGSRGIWDYTRIGRPDVVYDQRSTYMTDIDGYERSMKERSMYENVKNPVEIIAQNTTDLTLLEV